MTTNCKFPCEVKISSHQYHEEAWCYGVGISPEGKPYAIIYSNRKFRCIRLDEYYTLEVV